MKRSPTDTSTVQLLYLWLREHHRRGGGNTVRTTIPGSQLWNSSSWNWLHQQDLSNDSIHVMSYVLMWMGCGWGSLRGLTIKRNYRQQMKAGRRIRPSLEWASLLAVQCTVVNLETTDISTKMNSTGCNYVYMYTHIHIDVRVCVCV